MTLQSEKFIKRRRRRAIILVSSIVVCVAALVAGAVLLSRIDKLQITKIVVKGNYVVNSDDLVAIAKKATTGHFLFAFPKTNVFLYPKSEIVKEIRASYARVGNVTLDAAEPNVLTIEVDERKATSLWCSKNGEEVCYYMDDSGYVFERAPQFSGRVYEKYYGGNVPQEKPVDGIFLSQEDFQKVRQFIVALKPRIKSEGLMVRERGEYELYFRNDDGTLAVARFNSTLALQKVPSTLLTILDEYRKRGAGKLAALDYIDLRYGNNMVVKFRSASATSTAQEL